MKTRSPEYYRIQMEKTEDLNKINALLRGENYHLKKKLDRYVMKWDDLSKALEEKHKEEIRHLKYQLESSKKENEKAKEKTKKDIEEISRLRDVIGEKEDRFNELYEKYEKKISEYEKLIEDMEKKIKDLEDKNKKLLSQITKDFTNSSIPSSECRNRKIISNSRVKSGLSQGGQKGHKGHKRKQYEPDVIIELDVPESVKKDPSSYKDSLIIKSRDLVDIKVEVSTLRYISRVYENIHDHSLVYTPFPEGVDNETNYGKGVRVLSLLLNSYGNMPIRKTKEVLEYISEDKISLSIGAIASLTKRFSDKCEKEKKQILSSLYLSPYMHHDATYLRNNGKKEYVYVSSNGKDVLYQHFDKRNRQSLDQTPVKDYQFTIIHDHDKSYFNYGSSHQKCLAHELRYLEDSIINEEDHDWNAKMKKLIQSTIHRFKTEALSSSDIMKIEKEYDEILLLGQRQYEKDPPSKYYTDGYNTYKRFKDYKSEILYFLHHPKIPYTNNEAELRLRKVKRKARTVGSFRSSKNLDAYCDFLSVIETGKSHERNIYELIKEKM